MIHAHQAVAAVARELAHAVYEECARDNAWYRRHRNRAAFIHRVAPLLIGDARASLAQMLTMENVSEFQKGVIMEALAQDQTVPRGKGVTVQ